MIRNPVIETVLAAVILISIAAEIKTAGFSGGALAAAMAGAILIGANWYEEESFFWEFILYFGGLVLILTDILILMSGAGILCGLVLVLGGLFLTFGGGVEALYVLSFLSWQQEPGSISCWTIWGRAVCGRSWLFIRNLKEIRASCLPPAISRIW